MKNAEPTLIPNNSHWGAFLAEVADGRIVGVRPSPRDENPSPLITAVPDVVHAANRIARPMVRKGWLERGPASREQRGAEPFVPVSWDRALDLAADELARVKQAHGNTAIFGGAFGWASAGRMHNARWLTHRFLNCFGGCTNQSGNYSFGAASVIVPHIVGSMAPVLGGHTTWEAMAGNTQLVVAFGGVPLKNAQIEQGGMGSHTTRGGLKRMKEGGARFVQISPLKDDAADFLDAEWLPARPSTDAAIMVGLAHTLYTEGLHDAAFLARYTSGFEKFVPYLTGATDGTPKDAAWAARISGLDAERIRTLAREMAAHRTMIMISWSVQRTDHGEQPCWLAIVLAAMLGQIGLPGGGFGIGYAAVDGAGKSKRRAPPPTVPIGENLTRSVIPAARLADMLLNPGAPYDYNGERRTYPDIRLIYWAGGNPFHHHQDLNRLIAAWRLPDTVIVHEPWWTPLARHADIVFPATTPLERNDIGASTSSDNVFQAMKQAVLPVGEARNDFDIYAALAERLGIADRFTEGRDEMGWLRHIYDISRQQAARQQAELPSFDAFWEKGHVDVPVAERPANVFEDFRADPVKNKLNTPSGKIDIFSERIAAFGYDDCVGHPAWYEPVEWLGAKGTARFPLHLLSSQPRYRLHGQLDQGRVSQASKIQGREPVWINTADAKKRGIAHGEVVRLYNDRGACLAGAFVTDEVRPGVVILSTGAWYDPEQPNSPGSLEKHGNPNVLTLDKGTSKLAQATTAHSALVEIERWTGPLPAVTAHAVPEMAE
jgi:biotin/methionine sulfoxide reductase